ncbi:MAG: hypothetical protein QXX61_03685 [Ignisphaera sp.]
MAEFLKEYILSVGRALIISLYIFGGNRLYSYISNPMYLGLRKKLYSGGYLDKTT